MFKTIILSFFIFSFAGFVAAQDDTLSQPKDKWADYEHKPKRAVLWGLFPGAGQIYNEVGYRRASNKKHRAWWKVPVIYGGMGVCGYYFWKNFTNARDFKNEINYRREFGDTTNLIPALANYETEDELINGYIFNGEEHLGFNTYARRREIFIAATVGIYALSIIEAYVDAHFVTFDVSEDLSMRVMPTMINSYTPGVSIKFNFL